MRRIATSLLMMTLTLAAREGLAQPYPAKPIRIVMPFSTGGTDLVTRWLALKLAPAVGQQIVPEPRTGAGGNIGHELVAKATEGKNIDKMALFNEMMADPGFRAKIAKTYSIRKRGHMPVEVEKIEAAKVAGLTMEEAGLEDQE